MSDFYQWLMIVGAVLFIPIYAIVRDHISRKKSTSAQKDATWQVSDAANEIILNDVAYNIVPYKRIFSNKSHSVLKTWAYTSLDIAKQQSLATKTLRSYIDKPFVFPGYEDPEQSEGWGKPESNLPN